VPKVASPDDEANGPIGKQVQRVCHDTLPWLISFSLDDFAQTTAVFVSIGTVRSLHGFHREGKVSTCLTRFG
jgi:hypothetical protein